MGMVTMLQTISIATLDVLQDDEIRTVIGQCEGLLKRRDEQRKAKAIEDARAVQAKALDDARVVLAAAGLTLKSLGGNGKKRASRGVVYHGGHSYQHPTNKTLVWNAKGQKPNWLRELEAQGGKAVEIAGLAANDNAAVTRKSV
jgi:DNA-binding protein H-NS